MKKKQNIGLVILEICILVLSCIILLPLMIMILGSFKSPAEAAQFNLSLPHKFLFENYTYVFKEANILRATFNSAIVTILAVTICIISSALVSFIIARKSTKFTAFLSSFFLMGMIAPIQVITTFGLLQILHLTGTYIGVILVFAAIQLSWGVFMFVGFMKTIPKELDEAAFIDGCGPFQMFFGIILPLLKPVIVTTIIMVAMFVWNDFQIPLYFFNSSSRWTLPLTVYNFYGQYFNYWNYVFANLVWVALPITLLYLFCQRYIISGMTDGAIKG